MARPLQVVVISAHPLRRAGICAVLSPATGVTLVGQLLSVPYVDEIVLLTPGVVIVDAAYDRVLDGWIGALRREAPTTRIVVLAEGVCTRDDIEHAGATWVWRDGPVEPLRQWPAGRRPTRTPRRGGTSPIASAWS